jgi:hypothetical protein
MPPIGEFLTGTNLMFALYSFADEVSHFKISRRISSLCTIHMWPPCSKPKDFAPAILLAVYCELAYVP